MSNNYIPDPSNVPGDPANLQERVAMLSGVQQERHHNMMGEVAKQLGVRPEDTSDLIRLWQEANRRRSVIVTYADTLDENVRSSTTFTFEQGTQFLGEEVARRVVEEFHTFNKEQLLFILARWLTENIVAEYR